MLYFLRFSQVNFFNALVDPPQAAKWIRNPADHFAEVKRGKSKF